MPRKGKISGMPHLRGINGVLLLRPSRNTYNNSLNTCCSVEGAAASNRLGNDGNGSCQRQHPF